MAVVKCEKGHYYDDSKYEECPHCKDGITRVKKEEFIDDLGESRTIPMSLSSVGVESELLTVAIDDDTYTDEGVTIGAYNFSQGLQLLAGWLVAIGGPAKGRDYKLYYGWNKIGRDTSMDIYIPNDKGISRENHVAIVYEDKKNIFYLINQSGSLTYLNDKLVTDIKILENGDEIKIGDTQFVFIKFCTEGRKW